MTLYKHCKRPSAGSGAAGDATVKSVRLDRPRPRRADRVNEGQTSYNARDLMSREEKESLGYCDMLIRLRELSLKQSESHVRHLFVDACA